VLCRYFVGGCVEVGVRGGLGWLIFRFFCAVGCFRMIYYCGGVGRVVVLPLTALLIVVGVGLGLMVACRLS